MSTNTDTDSDSEHDRESHTWSHPVGEFAEWIANIGQIDPDSAFDDHPLEESTDEVETVLCYDKHRDEAILKTAEVPGVERPGEWMRINATALVEVRE